MIERSIEGIEHLVQGEIRRGEQPAGRAALPPPLGLNCAAP